tara:strand:+ start:3182 stop:4444 length:1263 start_codon:yes stop_codon:yes gene_type:complete
LNSGIPVFLWDRYPKDVLDKQFPQLSGYLERIGAISSDTHAIQYCGLVVAPDGETFMFLPRTGPDEPDQSATGLLADGISTMTTLTRFARESDRNAIQKTEGRGGTIAPIIEALAVDFRDHGIFNERLKTTGINSGKPDWKRTIKRVQALHTDDGPVFPEILTSRPFNSTDNVLAGIQAAVISEIRTTHGWWLKKSFGKRPPPRVPLVNYSRNKWIPLLRKFMRGLYMDRPLRLCRLLCDYLLAEADNRDGSFFCGLRDFHTVWERMLRDTLKDTESRWAEKLPLPVYVTRDGKSVPGAGMLPDIVIRRGDRLMVADAKYYAATSVENSPHLGDILKQVSYLRAIRTAVPSASAETCFVFPRARNTQGRFVVTKFRDREGQPVPEFDSIQCFYFPLMDVVENYNNHTLVSFDELTATKTD